MRCPGQDMRNLRVELVKCPQCGKDVEIFSDEQRVRCPQCGHKINRGEVPSCINWCSKARECLGEERWKQLQGDGESGGKK